MAVGLARRCRQGAICVMMLIAAMTGRAASAQPAQPVQPAERGGTGLSVAPVLLMLGDGRRATSTTITNPGATAATVQARLYVWTTEGEEDVYAPTRDIGFSPAVFRLAPRADQAVRLVTLLPPGPVERAYRLIIDQLPLADTPGQLQMPVRMVLPVFVAPVAGVAVAPMLEWSARFDAKARRIRMTCVNRGTGHAKLVDLAYQADGAAQTFIQSGLAGYALAGQTRAWSVAAERAPNNIIISAKSDAGPVHATIAVAR